MKDTRSEIIQILKKTNHTEQDVPALATLLGELKSLYLGSNKIGDARAGHIR